MSTQKKKNKNRPNKPQNPVPPQNVEAKCKESEDVEKTTASVVEKTEIQVKPEDRVPEILSEVGSKQVGDATEDNDSASPKKPKRNRGKKKKGDKDDSEDVIPTDNIRKDVKTSAELKDSEHAIKEQEIPKEEAQSVLIAPTNRKKKGKNKEQGNTDKIADSEDKPLLESTKEPVKDNILMQKEEICESKPQEHETKSSKKKNKKNKGQASEKSEKTEDLSCTKEAQVVTESEVKKTSAVTVEIDNEKPLEESKSQDAGEEGNKGKKKNKKEKKQVHKEVPDEKPTPAQLFNIGQDLKPMAFVELPDEKDKVIEIREEDSNILIVTAAVIDDITTPTVKEVSSKHKAKIAKPVEKKVKDKKALTVDLQEPAAEIAETSQKANDPKLEIIEEDDDLIMCPITDDSPDDVFVEVTKKKHKDKSSKSNKTDVPKSIESENVENISSITTDTKELEKTSEISKADASLKSSTEVCELSKKKHKKEKELMAKVEEQFKEEDKTEQRANAVSLALILGAMASQPSDIHTQKDKAVESPEAKKQNQNKSKAIPMPYFALEDTAPEVKTTTTDPKTEEVSTKAVVTPEAKGPLVQQDKIAIPESKKDKKRNKSPKPTKPEKDDIKLESSKASEKTTIGNEAESQQCEGKKSNTEGKPSQAKQESSQVEKEHIAKKSESATPHRSQASAKTPTDITPDLIESPRSSSADIIDDNNNMMILEINMPSPVTIPIVTPQFPLISGSSESPDVLTSESKVSKTHQKPEPNPEKSDVKSKMMEVNKDMEDLRLSIEKSLAELTALEKKDDELGLKPIVTKVTEVGLKKDTTHPLTPIEETETQLKLPTDLVKEQKTGQDTLIKSEEQLKSQEETKHTPESPEPPVCPSRKDNKGKNKSKKKDNKQAATQAVPTSESQSATTTTTTENKDNTQESKKEEKCEEQSQPEKKGKQQKDSLEQDNKNTQDTTAEDNTEPLFDPIENFEDAMTSSADDVNKSFEIIANESSDEILMVDQKPNPEINITEPEEVDKDKNKDNKEAKTNPIVSQPKNLLGHPVIPARSNKMDYKKEKNKTPNLKQAKVKIKDSNQVEIAKKESKESQTDNKPKFIKDKSLNESITCVTSENDEYVYKYSFRKVYLSSNCHVCKKELKENRTACKKCNLIFYCSDKHLAEDATQHQAFCFAVSTICHLKGQKHIYANTQSVTGQDYRLLRMQLIVSCEKILKRKLLPCEQEALLYPRVCADDACREWRMGMLTDCAGCGQISYCTANADHFPKAHVRWCKSYSLYQKLVVYQLTQGRLEPRLPTKVLTSQRISDNVNRLLADMYDERIDMTDIQYAALTQLATAPLTAAFSYQLYNDKMKAVQSNGIQKSSTFTIHVVGAELQFEADSLNKWEVFFLHLRPDVQELRVVLVGPELNPSNLPLDLLGNIKLCPTCRVERRRVSFRFQDKLLYNAYRDSSDFVHPDIVCAFNPSIHRSASYGHTSWPHILNTIFRLKVPFCITSYSMNELQRDLATIKRYSRVDYNTVSEAKFNPFASVRPDRNFVTDDEIPLLFKNYCFGVLIGAF